MKKIMGFFKEHRVFTMLMAIVVVCAIVIGTVLIQCFYVGNGSDKYGERLAEKSEHEISESRLSDFKNNVTNNEKVSNTEISITGRIIYIKLQLVEGATLEESKSIALKSLENFNESELSYYDVNVTMKQNASATSEGFIISGYKNKKSATIVWNNNRQITNTINSDTTEMG